MKKEEIENAIKGIESVCEDHQFNIGCFDKCETDGSNCFVKIVKEALEKAEKYRWHDLRKNPNDLPDVGDRNLLVSGSFRGAEMWTVCSFEEGVFKDGINPPKLFNKLINAWRYIEPFEEVNEREKEDDKKSLKKE